MNGQHVIIAVQAAEQSFLILLPDRMRKVYTTGPAATPEGTGEWQVLDWASIIVVSPKSALTIAFITILHIGRIARIGSGGGGIRQESS